MKESKINYFGILKDFDFNNINRDTFPVLLKSGIFNEFELSKHYADKENYFGIELSHQNESFCDFFLYNRKEYYLKKEVLIQLMNNQINSFNLFYEISDIEQELNLELSKEFLDSQKINVLENFFKKYQSQLTNKIFYNDYEKIKESKNIDKWIEYLFDEIDNQYSFDYDIRYNFIILFLKGQKNNHFYFPEKVCLLWKESFIFYKLKKHLEFLKNKILGITSNKLTYHNISTPSKEELSIFKNEGLSVFECIVSNYDNEKNKAFFSYLFHFMRNKDLLRTNAKTSSKKYIEYISNNFNLEMSKVINSTANEQTEFELKMALFEDILKLNKI